MRILKVLYSISFWIIVIALVSWLIMSTFPLLLVKVLGASILVTMKVFYILIPIAILFMIFSRNCSSGCFNGLSCCGGAINCKDSSNCGNCNHRSKKEEIQSENE